VNPDLRLEWGNWLETWLWDFFITVTCREPLPAHRSDSVLNSIGKQLCTRFQPEMLFLGAESHISRLTHFHGLYRATDGPWRENTPTWLMRTIATDVWSCLFETYGRSKVERIRGAKDVSTYVAKYCTKELGSYGLFGRPDWELGT